MTWICEPIIKASHWTSTRPRSPRAAFIEAFNSKFLTKYLNVHWFMMIADVDEKMEDWRRDFNEVRPHSAIGYNVPIDKHNLGRAASPSS